MKITFLLPAWCDSPIGGYRVVYEYSNRMVRKGHSVTVIHPAKYDPRVISLGQAAALFIAAAGRRPTRVRPSWFPLDRSVQSLLTPGWEEKYVPDADAIIATGWQTAEWMSRYPDRKGQKFYLIQSYETWSGPEDRVRATWSLPCHKIVIAKWLLDLAEEMGLKGLSYIPNGIDFTVYRETSPLKERNPYRVCMIYHVNPCKGFKYGLEALEMVRRRYPKIEVDLFSIHRKRREVPEWMRYHFNPPQGRIVDIYNSSSIYVSPSLIEGWALPPAEAMACGCALVSTDIGGVRDYAIDQETALLSPPQDAGAMAENIMILLEDHTLRIRMAEKGKRHIGRYTWEAAADLLEASVKSMI